MPKDPDKPEEKDPEKKEPEDLDYDNADLDEELEEISSELPVDKREKLKRIIHVKSTSYSGPLPHPQMLLDYDDILPGGAERIFTQFEEQGRHRRKQEDRLVKSQTKESNRGQIMAFTLAIIFALLSFIAAIYGHTWYASIVGGSTLISLVVAFLGGKKTQNKDLEDKEISSE